MDFAALPLIMIVVFCGSFILGTYSAKAGSRAVRAILLIAGISTPLLGAASLFIFIKPTQNVFYNLMPFLAALLLTPVSAAATFWARRDQFD